LPLVWTVAQALLDHPGQVQTNGDLVWRRMVVRWSRGSAGVGAEDDAVCTFDLVNITNSEVDPSWTQGDYGTVMGPVNTFLSQVANQQASSYNAHQVDFYRMQFASPMTPLRRFVPSGPPEFTQTTNHPGLAVGDPLPPQNAFSVTEKTAIPRHWGRFYLPGYTESESIGSLGRWNPGIVDGTVSATQGMYAALAGAQFFPVVVSTQVDNVLAGSLIGVTNIKADDVVDIIRRRRLRAPTHISQLP